MIDQKNIRIGTHGEKYGNWMSNPFLGMIGGIGVMCPPKSRVWINMIYSMRMGGTHYGEKQIQQRI